MSESYTGRDASAIERVADPVDHAAAERGGE
jgi:hypothetical protein